jgi:hypothetical protein
MSMLEQCWQSARYKQERLLVGDPQHDEKWADINSEREACETKANAVSEVLRIDSRQYRNDTLVFDAGLLAFFWLLAWIVVRVGRWVIAGLRQKA